MKMVRRGGYREKFGQRLGIYDRELHAREVARTQRQIEALLRRERHQVQAPETVCVAQIHVF